MFSRVCRRISQLMFLWVIVASVGGYLYPPLIIWMKPHLEGLFALTMLGIGMVMKAGDFEPVIRQPKYVALGMVAQFGIMPLSAFIVARLLRLPPDLALGLIMAGAAPDAMAAGVVTYAAHADVAYSVALTSTSTLLAPLLTPAFTYLFGREYFEVKFWVMFASIMKMVIMPLFAGMALKHLAGRRIDRIVDLFPALSSIFIAGICGLVVALNKDHLVKVSLLIFLSVFLLNAMGLVLGYWAGRLFRFDIRRCRTLAIGVGMQNAGLGAVLAIKHFSAQAAVPNALFATWCIISASLLAWYWNRKDARIGNRAEKR